jgi:hypothetical protein
MVTGYEMRLRPSRPPPLARPPPARPVPPCNYLPETSYRDTLDLPVNIGCLVDEVGEGESPAHAPRYPYRLGINGTV